MATVEAPRKRMVRPLRRSIAVLAALGFALLVLLAMTLAFLWPAPRQYLDLGSVRAFEPGSVTSFRLVDEGAMRVADAPRQRVSPRYGVHIARLDDGEFRAFSWASPHLGWAAQWRPQAEWNGVQGLFDDGFSHWRLDGTVVFGPAPRGLDEFPAEVSSQGRVIVDISRRIEGERPERPSTDGTSAPTATPPGGREG